MNNCFKKFLQEIRENNLRLLKVEQSKQLKKS